MDFNPAGYQSKGYVISTPVYAGPLDLLLHLIERAELDITRLALAEVTDQYLEHLRGLQEQQAEEVSAFLVIAARLLQIKSEVLLPRPPVRQPGEEDLGDALVQQLIIYKRFKTLAAQFGELEAQGKHTYLRLSPAPHVEAYLEPGEYSLADLLAAAQAIFIKEDERLPLDEVISLPRITIREKIHYIATNLQQEGKISFRQLLSQQPRPIEIIITFLAMLELIKRNLVLVQQERLFADIQIENIGLTIENEIFELEFGEE